MTKLWKPVARYPRLFLGLGAVALVLGIVAGGMLRAGHLERNAFGGLRHALAGNARQAASTVEHWLIERRTDATVTGRHLAALVQSPDHFAVTEIRARAATSLAEVRSLYEYHDTWALDSAANPVIHIGAAGDRLGAGELEAVRTAIRSGNDQMVGPFADADGRILLTFISPVKDRFGRPLGAVGLRADVGKSLLERLPVGLPGSQTGQSRLVARLGDEFVVISASLYPAARPFERRVPWADARDAGQLATSGVDTTGLFSDASGARILAAVHPVRGTSWGIVRSMHASEVISGYRQQLLGEFQALMLAAIVVGLLVFATGRARKRRNQRDTAASRALLAEAQALGQMGSWTWEPDFNNVTWTPELFRILGYEPGDISPSIGALVAASTPEDSAAVRASLEALVSKQMPVDLEHRIVRPGGEVRVVHAISRPVPRPDSTDGSPIYLGVLADVTERRELQARLVQAQKMQAVGLLAGGIAHDFNNMLTAVMASCDTLTSEFATEPEALSEVRGLRTVAERAGSLTTQLLAFTRQQVLQTELLDINGVVAESEQLIRRVIPADIVLRRVPSPNPACVRADPAQLQQVLLNLALNARDAMPSGGVLTFSTTVRRSRESGRNVVILVVSDTGTGMTPEVMARLFEPFFTTKERGKGTGLGLSTAQGIVMQFGGELSVESAPGKGSAFTITLPQESGLPEPAPAEAEPPMLDGTETILLVEDDADVRRTACRVLQRHGYRVLEAADGMEGVRIAETTGGVIDLLLTDAVMPNLAGREVAQRVSAIRPGIKVILMSGYTDDEALRKGLSARRYPFLQKPFQTSELALIVRRTLDGHGEKMQEELGAQELPSLEPVPRE